MPSPHYFIPTTDFCQPPFKRGAASLIINSPSPFEGEGDIEGYVDKKRG